MSLFGKRETSSHDNIYWESRCKTLELNVQKLTQQNQQLQGLVDSFRNDARKNMSELQRVAQTICDNDFAREQLGGKNRILALSSFELAEFVIDNWRKQREEAIDLIIDLQKAFQQKEAEVKDLETQLERLLTDHREQSWSQQHTSPSFPTVHHQGKTIDVETGEILSDTPTLVTPSSHPKETPPATDDTSPKTHLILVEDIENQLGEISWKILEAIGKEGKSESKEIQQYLQQHLPESNQYQFSNALNALKNHLLLAEDKVNTGYRWFHAYHLTDLGLQLYKKRFKKPAVLCEKHLLQKENATWDHGYTIKDTAFLMEDMGFTQITYSRKDNEIKLSNGKVWIPDITAYDTLSNKKVYVEVELGHHTQDEFNEKMDKARQVTQEVRFVTNGKQSMDTIIQQFSRWKLEKTKQGAPVKNFDVHITTTKKLSEKDWGNHYPS